MADSSFYRTQFSKISSLLPSGCQLLIVSKHRSVDEIKAYYDLGHRDFGENRVQELLEKSHQLSDLCPEIRWHMIGHLQSNKIKQLLTVPHLVSIHSVHDASLLEKLLLWDEKLDHRLGLFLQVNTSLEEEKSGFENEEEVLLAAKKLKDKKHFYLQGLMTMGRIRTEDLKREARVCFKLLNTYKSKCESIMRCPLETSMGMSQDFEIAMEEKSNWIRLGSVMFEKS